MTNQEEQFYTPRIIAGEGRRRNRSRPLCLDRETRREHEMSIGGRFPSRICRLASNAESPSRPASRHPCVGMFVFPCAPHSAVGRATACAPSYELVRRLTAAIALRLLSVEVDAVADLAHLAAVFRHCATVLEYGGRRQSILGCQFRVTLLECPEILPRPPCRTALADKRMACDQCPMIHFLDE